MNYIKTVYRNGKRTNPPSVVSADEFNRILVMTLKRIQNGENVTFYSETDYSDSPSDVSFYKITYEKSDSSTVIMHFFEPYPDNCRNLSLFCDMEMLDECMYSFSELEKKIIDSNYDNKGESAFEQNSKMLRDDRKNGVITESEYQELRGYNLKCYSELPF